MKKLLFVLALFFGLVYTIARVNAYRHRNEPIIPNHLAVYQAKTSHMIELRGPSLFSPMGKIGICTGTAIGAHAILTAEHCDVNGSIGEIKLDYGVTPFHIQSKLKDDNEHIIFLLDGPALVYVQSYQVRAAKIGEHEFFYGFGRETYPATKKDGIVLDEYDPSEVNQSTGLMYYSSIPIPGDSGAAVYGDDGSILTLVTFHVAEDYLLTSKEIMGGYALRFTPEQIKKAQAFVPSKETQCVHTSKRPKSIKFLF